MFFNGDMSAGIYNTGTLLFKEKGKQNFIKEHYFCVQNKVWKYFIWCCLENLCESEINLL